MSGRALPPVVCFATQGTGSDDEERIRALLAPMGARVIPVDRSHKPRVAAALLWRLLRARRSIVVMEGTGVFGGLAVLMARALAGTRYVVSTGDAVAPFLAARWPLLGPVAAIYERLLYRSSAGVIGWSPYLVGRALTLGAPRAMTAANWAPHVATEVDRQSARRRFGIAADATVFGIVGSLAWHPRRGYCYGAELVRAARMVDRDDLVVLVVGDGDGRARLQRLAGEALGTRVLLPGRIPRAEVPLALAAMDVGSLPQSLDGVGSFRYTTKISEYLAAGLPIVTGQIPLAYDLDDGWLWRLGGAAPWDARFVGELSRLMATLTPEEIALRRACIPAELPAFSLERQRRQVGGFIGDIARGATSPRRAHRRAGRQG